MTYANAIERQAVISGLRELADFLESNPDVPGLRLSVVRIRGCVEDLGFEIGEAFVLEAQVGAGGFDLPELSGQRICG